MTCVEIIQLLKDLTPVISAFMPLASESSDKFDGIQISRHA